jgi:dephospho-CoA kinase
VIGKASSRGRREGAAWQDARVLRLGLTGGIGAGKSTVARRLAELGAVVVDADQLAREVVEPGSPGLAAVVEAFGDGVLTADGALDRPALGAVVFADGGARSRLNAILHPRIAALTRERLATLPPEAIAVHDVPLLVENGMGANYHLVLVVHAPVEDRVRRLVSDRGMTEGDARARIASQADDDARWAAADVWLDNAGSVQHLVEQVDRLWADRVVPFDRNLRQGRPAEPRVGAPVPADPSWPAQAARLVARVTRAWGERAGGDHAVRVAHVGPTAVPGVAAPDLLELELVVADPAALTPPGGLDEALEVAGFVRCRPPANAGARAGQQVFGSADPCRPATLRARPAGPEE